MSTVLEILSDFGVIVAVGLIAAFCVFVTALNLSRTRAERQQIEKERKEIIERDVIYDIPTSREYRDRVAESEEEIDLIRDVCRRVS